MLEEPEESEVVRIQYEFGQVLKSWLKEMYKYWKWFVILLSVEQAACKSSKYWNLDQNFG